MKHVIHIKFLETRVYSVERRTSFFIKFVTMLEAEGKRKLSKTESRLVLFRTSNIWSKGTNVNNIACYHAIQEFPYRFTTRI